MTAMDDLNASEATLENVVGALVADISTLATELAAAQAANNDAAIEAVVTKMNALATSGQAALPAAVANQLAAG